jgi:hypothetical protein
MYSHCMFMYDYPDWGFSVLFPQLQGKCQGKARKDGARPALFLIFVLFYVLFVFFYVFLCCSMYCLCFSMYFCVVLCIVCVFLSIFVFYVLFVFFYVFLCCSMYCLFCVVLCIVFVYMCTELLPPGGYPIAVKYIISWRQRHTVPLQRWYPLPNLQVLDWSINHRHVKLKPDVVYFISYTLLLRYYAVYWTTLNI